MPAIALSARDAVLIGNVATSRKLIRIGSNTAVGDNRGIAVKRSVSQPGGAQLDIVLGITDKRIVLTQFSRRLSSGRWIRLRVDVLGEYCALNDR